MNKNLLKISENFQVSVNISYDLHDKEKLRNFILTSEGLELIEEFFESVFTKSSNRSHILIGAYGKGKSHIVLEILNLLFEKDISLFEPILQKIADLNPGLCEDLKNYLLSDKKILPVVISGASTSLSQSFLRSLYSALKENDLGDFFPDTNFDAAIRTIQKWKNEFPIAYKTLGEKLNISVTDFENRLLNFDSESYALFEELYPQITSGSRFNPFENYDIVELYEQVNKKLCQAKLGYAGIFVVYDEFSKYLESSISKASINDIKLLQDFAEKCVRSGENPNEQLHILLISHKEIANYIDVLPKEKVDGWKSVSERFRAIVMKTDYSQVYEVMENVLQKDEKLWQEFLGENGGAFEAISENPAVQKLLPFESEKRNAIILGCYPLCPFTTYILPRLSEKIAQNERTMFTFLAGHEKNTLSEILENARHSERRLLSVVETSEESLFITPDFLFDYFENLLRSESYTSPIKKIYNTAKKSLGFAETSLEQKILKTLCLIYVLDQFERLSPTTETLHSIFTSGGFNWKEINEALENLCDKKNVLYLRKSNGFLQLKESSQINISELVQNMTEKRRNKISFVEILNKINHEKYLYPVEYNIDTEMTRYFSFDFIEESDFLNTANFDLILRQKKSDGLVLGVLKNEQNNNCHAELDSASTTDRPRNEFGVTEILKITEKNPLLLVISGEKNSEIEEDVRKLDAIAFLKAANADDKILFDELSLLEEDLEEVALGFIQNFTHPENAKCFYFSRGEQKKIFRRSVLSRELSELCKNAYTKTPKINNEPLNKNTLTAAADKSRKNLIEAILNSKEENLGITGGQELSFLRSTLVVPRILSSCHAELVSASFDTKSENLAENFQNLFDVIKSFVENAKKSEIPFSVLIEKLTLPGEKIALRKGVIPIYVAVVFSKIKKNVVLKNSRGEEIALNASNLCEITENPEEYALSVVDFDEPKAIYIEELYEIFCQSVVSEKKSAAEITYSEILAGIENWARGLPKFSRTKKTDVPKEFFGFMAELKNANLYAQEFLFRRIPEIFDDSDFAESLVFKIKKMKAFYETILNDLHENLVLFTKKTLCKNAKTASETESLCNVGKKFFAEIEKVVPNLSEHKFENSAEKLYTVFASCGNDGHKIVTTLAVFLTGMNTVDWNEETVNVYERRLCEFVETIVTYSQRARGCSTAEGVRVANGAIAEVRNTRPDTASLAKAGQGAPKNGKNYRITFSDGEELTADFDKIECSKKAVGLRTEIENIFDEYGQSVSVGERRQVLIEILKELCR